MNRFAPFEWIAAFRFMREGMMQTLLIVVGVAMDTVNQVESQLIMRHYDGFLKKGRVRGRRG